MRSILCEQNSNKGEGDHKGATKTESRRVTMLKDVKAVLTRSSATLWQDAIGGMSLLVVLFGALHLPGVI